MKKIMRFIAKVHKVLRAIRYTMLGILCVPSVGLIIGYLFGQGEPTEIQAREHLMALEPWARVLTGNCMIAVFVGGFAMLCIWAFEQRLENWLE